MNTESTERQPEVASDMTITEKRESPAAAPAASAPPVAAAGTAPAVAPEMSPATCGARLAELFPMLFVAPGAPGPVKPIKLRIHADIQARAPGEFSKRLLGIFFSRYTTTNAYLKALTAPGAQRFDLDGQPAGEIADEPRAAAAEELARRQAIAAERRAAQRQQRLPMPARRDEAAPDPASARAAPRRSSPQARPQGDGPAHEHHGPHAPRPPRGDGHRGDARRERPDPRTASGPRAPAHDTRPPTRPNPRMAVPPSPDREPAAALPADPAMRERALLLRSYEASTLSKANFCALKRITEAELDAALTQARAERG
jgi:sRNA-binding protein